MAAFILVACVLILLVVRRWFERRTRTHHVDIQRKEKSIDYCTITAEENEQYEKIKKSSQEEQESLMKLAEKHRLREKQRNGLKIISAQYGLIDTNFIVQGTSIKMQLVIDVKAPIEFLIEKDSTVHIPGGIQKSLLGGFRDPCPNRTTKKILRVIYRYRGDLCCKRCEEDEELK
ncbi:hypothetical protein AKO1_007880, partial [Acrasis kona]